MSFKYKFYCLADNHCKTVEAKY